ncbi:MAG TPA: flagellar biosynthetic protein FliR [Nocardioides sp.]|nr:flagellar biosynthetic protein FliR [Nocardioides sp.]
MTLYLVGDTAYAVLLASVRLVAWLVIAPPFNSRTVPMTVKVVLGFSLACAAAPILAESTLPTDLAGMLGTVVAQVVVGAAMGFLTSVLFAAVTAAGAIVDLLGGFSIAQAFDPMSSSTTTVIGHLHQMIAVLLLFASGGHLVVIGGLMRSFELLPVGALPDLEGLPDILSHAISLLFVTAVQIALPLAAVLFLADLGLALMTKIAPQLNALNVMFPAKVGLTLLLVGLSFATLPWAVDRAVELTMQATAAFTGGSG